MTFPLLAAAALTLPTAALALVVGLVRWSQPTARQ